MSAAELLRQAVAHHQAGHLADAEGLYRRVLAADPNEPDALHLLGVLLGQAGNLDAAIDLISRAVKARPDASDFHANLGGLYLRQQKPSQAIGPLQRAVQLNPNFADAHFNLAVALKDQACLPEAALAMKRAIELNAAIAQRSIPFIASLRNLGHLDAALALSDVAARANPNSAVTQKNLGVSLAEKGAFEDAVAAYRRAVSMNPADPDVHNQLGNALRNTGRLDDAIQSLQKSIELDPSSASAHNNLGVPLQDSGRLEEAIAAWRKAISLDPSMSSAHCNLGLILLSMARFDEGWKEFEWRLKVPTLSNHRNFPQPQWDGSNPFGKTILFHAEGGHGDAIHFVRYLPLMSGRGARIILECHKGLIPLFHDLPGVDQVFARDDCLPPFDLHVPLPSLPGIFQTNLQNIPSAVPYLRTPDSYRQRWKDRLPDEGNLKVGLVWAGAKYRKPGGEPRTRGLNVFAPLAEIPDMTLYTLQKGPESSQPRPPGLNLIDLTEDLHDFADTAAMIEQLDLVVTVDTSVAHLAGALAKPVWVLIPFPPDFRWLLDRTDSPWYPTMRLFRQSKRGDWGKPLAELFEELCRLSTSSKP